MAFLAGKRALIIGLATERSIAFGIAQALKREGAELAFSYQERFKDRVEGMGKEFGAASVFEMDVASDESIAAGFETLKKSLGQSFDIHSCTPLAIFAPFGCNSRRLRRVDDSRKFPHRPRHFQLQPHCRHQGG